MWGVCLLPTQYKAIKCMQVTLLPFSPRFSCYAPIQLQCFTLLTVMLWEHQFLGQGMWGRDVLSFKGFVYEKTRFFSPVNVTMRCSPLQGSCSILFGGTPIFELGKCENKMFSASMAHCRVSCGWTPISGSAECKGQMLSLSRFYCRVLCMGEKLISWRWGQDILSFNGLL